ncbi:MAG: hypothetical protein V3R37_04055, partial [Rhodospirillales bacterium]
MTVSRARKISLLVMVAVSGMVGLSNPSQAQQPPSTQPIQLSPPQKLTPPAGLPPTGSPPTVSAPAAAAMVQPVVSTPKSSSSGVQIDSLQTIAPDTAGTLTADQGGLGADMWAGTERAIVEKLLPQLPVGTSSAGMRNLMRRLLLSIARVPEGKPSGISLIAIRTKLLAAMGDMVAVNALLNATPGRATNKELVRVETETRFMANDNARACVLAGGQVRDQNIPYWQKAFLFCQSLAGEHGKASLGVSIMRETGEKDEVFFTLIEALAAGEPVTIDSLKDPTPLHLAMARVARATLPADVILSNRPGVLRTIAVSPNAPVELRLEAAERAEAAGALPVDSLRQLYTSIQFSESDLANPLTRAEAEGGPMTRALLYHTSLIQTVPTAQAEVVARALALGRKEGRYASVVRVFMPVLKNTPPSAELLWFAPEAVRALLLNNETIAAEAWFALIRASGLFNRESSQSLDQLMPIVRLMGSREADDWTTDKFSIWWNTAKKRPNAIADAGLLYSLFDAIGEPVPAKSWEDLVTGTGRKAVSMPNPALWYRLLEATEASRKGALKAPQASAQSGEITSDGGLFNSPDEMQGQEKKKRQRVAETVLLALLALGEGGPAAADPLLLRQVLISLRAAGFEKEARSMAVEA